MSQMKQRFSLMLLLLLLASFNLPAQQEIPSLKARVTDLTNTLTTQQIKTLEEKLHNFEEQKGSQVAVLIIPTTDPETIEQYGIRVAEAWKIGREDVDDGVILIVAKDDRKLRIEVGYGLEGALPDAYAKRIIENIIVPDFRKGQFYQGLSDGVGAIMGLIDGEDLPEVTQAPTTTLGVKTEKFFIFLIMIVLLALSIVKAMIKKSKYKWLATIITGIIAWLVFGSLLFGGIGLLIAIFVMFSEGSGRGGGRFYGGGFSGGGTSFGGGGFSGGGGGFGGGGASGGW